MLSYRLVMLDLVRLLVKKVVDLLPRDVGFPGYDVAANRQRSSATVLPDALT